MKRRVVRSVEAVEDLLSLLDHLMSTVGVEAALAVDGRLAAAIESLDELSHRGRVVPELRVRGITSYRELLILPYRVIYRVEPREVWIVAVLDHRRDLDELLHQRARRDPAP